MPALPQPRQVYTARAGLKISVGPIAPRRQNRRRTMAKGKAQDLFRAKAPGIMALLMRDFPLDLGDVTAMLGNFGHECAGFTAMQEISPTIVGSRGGYGWPMLTGPRRRSYEAYCKRNRLDPASDRANYGFLFSELKGPERKAIDRLKAAKGLNAKVKAFELAYERAGAGTKHYASRNQWAAASCASPLPNTGLLHRKNWRCG
jgi:hypothetical protein